MERLAFFKKKNLFNYAFLIFIFSESGLRLRVTAEYVQPEGGTGAIWPQPNAFNVLTEFPQVLIACLWQHLHL